MSNPLQQALETLTPTDWSSVPVDNLEKFLKDVFNQAELIAESVPPYPGGEIYDHVKLTSNVGADSATSADQVTVSEARLPAPPSEHEELQKHWGKPVKVSDSSNPLKQTVWKMAGADRHGAWFARKSVHEGMGFERWKRAMKGEFAKSVEVTGGPGAGAVRGVGADARVEHHEVEGLGILEVWHLSAQFPKPVTSREFVTMLLTTDKGLSNQAGRYFCVVSIPVEHPQANARSELVRGNYESVEMIRELPIIKSQKSSEDKDGKKSNKEAKETPGNDDQDPERNPVEWLMVTRSDPGGGIPRFMVERNTPASITADANKFVEWAAKGENIPSDEKIEELKKKADIEETDTPAAADGGAPAAEPAASKDPQALGTNESLTARYEHHDKPNNAAAANGGILASLTSAAAALGSGLQAGVGAYMPESVQAHLPTAVTGRTDRFADDTSSDSDSISSFESAQDYHHGHHYPIVAAPVDQDPLAASIATTNLVVPSQPTGTLSTPNLPSSTNRAVSPHSVLSDTSSTSSHTAGDRKISKDEKELQKIMAKRRSIAERFSLQEARDEQRQKEITDRASRESEKRQKQLEKERRKNADKYAKEMAKIEDRQRREEKKLERKRLKEENSETIVRLGNQVNELLAENEGLREQVVRKERHITGLEKEVAKLSGGEEVVKQIRAEHQEAVVGANSSTSVD